MIGYSMKFVMNVTAQYDQKLAGSSVFSTLKVRETGIKICIIRSDHITSQYSTVEYSRVQ